MIYIRLWPYQMLDVLPTRQLVAQWRECLAISGTVALHGKLNHSTVNRMNDFPIEHFAVYCDLVREEFERREFTIGTNTLQKLHQDINYGLLEYKVEKTEKDGLISYKVNGEDLFGGFHDIRNIKQCLYGFQERYDTDNITEDQWKVIHGKFSNLIEY